MKSANVVLGLVLLAGLGVGARTISSVEPITSGDTVTGYTLTFSAAEADETNGLYVVWGTSDAGSASLEDWEHISDRITLLAPETTSYTYMLSDDVKGPFVRFFMGNVLPYDDEVEYLEATANGTYAMTDFTPTGKTAVEAQVVFTSLSDNATIFCARTANGNLSADTFTLFRAGGNWRFDYNAIGGNCFSVAANTSYTLHADYTGLEVNGQKYTTGYGTVKSYTAGGKMALFASYGTSTHVPDGNWARMRLYSFKAWSDYSDAGSLALDLVPCKKDGAVSLYDRVSNSFIPLTGTFSAGPVTGVGMTGKGSVFSELQVLPRRVIVAQGTAFTGTVDPAYGVAVPATGSELVCTAAALADARHFSTSCSGYTLETWNGTAWSETETMEGASYTYPAADTAVRRLTWQWTRAVDEGWTDNITLLEGVGVALNVDNAEKAWFKDWLAGKGITAAVACTYDEIRYAGAGEITNVSELASYTGTVRVKAGAQVVAAAGNAFGAAASAVLRVEKGGCVRIWSAAKNGTLLRVKAAYLAGSGRDGRGCLYSVCPTASATVWPLNEILTDDVRIGWANGNQDFYGVTFDLNGHDLNFLSRAGSYDRLGGGSALKDSSTANNGRVIIDNAMLFEGNLTYCATGLHELVLRTNGQYRTNGGQGYGATGDWTNHWKMVMAGPTVTAGLANYCYAGFHAGIGRNGWRAPLEIRTPSILLRQDEYSSQTFFGPVSGTGGLGDQGTCSSKSWWRLANAANSFRGGVALQTGSYLSAQMDGAVPADAGAGAVSFKNGCTFWLTDGVSYHLPDFRLTGDSLTYTGLVHGASSGAFKTVVKADATLMNWRSGTGAAVLDLQRGVFRIPSPLAGLYEGFASVKNAGSSRATVTNTVQFLPIAMQFEGNVGYRSDRGTTGTYCGYIWNRAETDVTWGFACAQSDAFRMYIDNELVLSQTSYAAPVFAQKTLTPGAHAFEIRYQGDTSRGTKVNGFYPWSDQYKGWGVDRVRGGARTNTTDYVVISDPGDGSLFTLAKTVDELPEACRLTPPVFTTLVATNLAQNPVLDLCGNALTVTNVVGAPLVTNMAVGVAANTFTVTEKWTLASKPGTGTKRVSVGEARVTGTLVLGTDAAPITIDADEPESLDRTREYTLVTADTLTVKGSRVALSSGLAGANWHVKSVSGGKGLALFYAAGTTVIVR